MAKALEEMFTWMRGIYLVMLFLPALLTAPLCISLGYRRASWVRVSCWFRVCSLAHKSSPAAHAWQHRALSLFLSLSLSCPPCSPPPCVSLWATAAPPGSG